ncbi:MAG: hypothetical protein DI527_18135 [Chelatococcus sp.]|nr:MAG: hypothetical protein DI527_18135 [Chelatococcus sp.]
MATSERDRHVMDAVSRDMQRLARLLDVEIQHVAGERVAFSLFVWTRGRCSYVSSGTDRAQIISVLESMIARWKAGMPDVPAHLAGSEP